MKKVTLATIKKFVRDNKDNLYFKLKSSFDGMTDCVEQRESGWRKVTPDLENINGYTMGIDGAWFVGSSRDYFTPIENGYEVYNCCGSFYLTNKGE